MDKYKKLQVNSLVFAIGNFGSSVLSFLMIPLYTAILTTSQYGMVDFIQTTVMLLAPIVGLSLYEATLRFSMEKGTNLEGIVSTSFISTVTLTVSSIGIIWFFKNQLGINYFGLFSALIFFTVINTLVQNYTRATGFIKTYAASGVLATISLIVSNLILLLVFKLGVEGFLISLIISLLSSILFNSFSSGFFKKLNLKKVSLNMLVNMLRYSVPLIPNSISWWLTSDVNKFFIVFYLGTAANGQFAIASKPGAILSLIFSIFAKSWQLSATEEIQSDERHTFFSDIFTKILQVHILMIGLVLVIVHPAFLLLFSAEYSEVWKVVPLMLLSVMFSNFAAFLGVSYLAGKKTLNILISTVFAGLINVSVNYILIPNFGLYGAAIGSMSAFLFLFLFRLIDTQKFVSIQINVFQFITNFTLIILLGVNVVFNDFVSVQIMIDGILLAGIILYNRSLFATFRRKIR